MQTIRIDVKDMYVNNILEMLNSLQDIMIDKIKLDSLKEPFSLMQDREYQEDRAMLEVTLEDYRKNGSKNFSCLDKNYWSDVQNRLIARHQKAD
ncbi:hypothetical protein GSY74_02935 [Sulfurovum sp. bin170]|uniref:hypothetical protein n=1 Tax=Sulfurovum sp. bin170 TaxID=2695268 RepID=UPI0013DF4912|nr:hypothetical protein [Sulfurovum sp. bin170]NEW60228.1 hypothetical protein [Sulfurovum sp. bin170]